MVRSSGFPWSPAAAGSAGGLIRRHGRRAMLAAFPPPARPVAAFLMTLSWPFAAARQAWGEAGLVAPEQMGGRGRGALALTAWVAALRHNIPPVAYLAYRLGERQGNEVDRFVYDPEIVWLLRRLTAREAAECAYDKLAFAEFCRAQKLQHVQILARSDAGPQSEPDEDAVVVKPRRGSNARDIAIWRRGEGGWSDGRRCLSWPDLLAALRAEGAGEMLVQPLLAPHPALAHLPGPGAAAARLVTGQWRDGGVELLHAMLAVPPEGSATSNGGERRRLDIETGRTLALGEGRLRLIWGRREHDTRLDALTLPDWARAQSLVLQAHRSFPAPAVLLGWDVAFTPDGPVLIETNAAIGFFLEQMETLEPAGDTRAAELVASWLR